MRVSEALISVAAYHAGSDWLAQADWASRHAITQARVGADGLVELCRDNGGESGSGCGEDDLEDVGPFEVDVGVGEVGGIVYRSVLVISTRAETGGRGLR